MKKFIILVVFVLAMNSFTSAQSSLTELNNIKQIKVLYSSRDEVRKILADYDLEKSDDSEYVESYSKKKIDVEVTYSKGKCSENSDDSEGSEESEESGDWNVSKWLVTQVVIKFDDSIPLENSKMDFSSYRKERHYANQPENYIYHNKDDGIAVEIDNQEIKSVVLVPHRNDYFSLCSNEKAKKLYARKNWFDSELKERNLIIDTTANVNELILSKSEMFIDCSRQDSADNNSCYSSAEAIDVFVTASDPEDDVLTYNYIISGGKIIGEGSKVQWDLYGEKPGTYKITVGVDDGCGVCGKTVTKTVVIKECPNCSIR